MKHGQSITKLLSLLPYHILADEQYVLSIFAQIQALASADEAGEFVRENLERNSSWLAMPEADGSMEYGSVDREDEIPMGSIFITRVDGPIMPRSSYGYKGLDQLTDQLLWAANHPNIAAMVMQLETGGGSVYKLWEYSDRIKGISELKPVLTHMTGACCSAGISLSCAPKQKETYAAHSSTMVGSIGAAVNYLDMIGWFEKAGCKYHYVNADTNPDKNKSFNDLRKGDYKAIKEELNILHAEFRARVRESRGEVADSSMTGKVYSAKEAQTLNIIDGIASLEEVVFRAKELTNNT